MSHESGRAAPVPHTTRDVTTYSGNRADDDSTNIYGNVYGDVHFPERPHGAGELSPHQCLRDLRVTDPSVDRGRIEGSKDRLLRDCYTWVLDDASFQRWRTHRDSRLLWIRGDPGKGKTMMTMGVIAELSQGQGDTLSSGPVSRMISKMKVKMRLNSGPHLLAYFFCQSKRPELNNAVSVLRGLIYMLVAQREQLLQYVQKRYAVVGKELFEGPNAIYALREMLSSIVNDISLPTTYLLVDALDECATGLPDLLHIITDDNPAQRSRVKWLVTSRNVPDIERYLQPDAAGIQVSLEVSASHVSKAVAVFVDFKVQRLATAQRWNARIQAEVQQQLRSKAEGTFLWVSLMCKELENVEYYRTREVLRELPPGLGSLYDRMMARIVAQDPRTVRYCCDILRSIILALRPLYLEELAAVVGLPEDQFHDLQVVADVVSRCGSFLTVNDGVVSFIHPSARDYFTVGNGWQVFDSPPAEEQGLMTCRLLDAMDSTLQRDMCSLQKPGVRVEEARSQIQNSCLPQIAYACEYWVEHLQAGGNACNDILAEGSKVHSFFQKHLVHWLEAMSLLQKMPEAISALQKLELTLHKGAESALVSNVVHDAVRFSMWIGSGIQEAPLQVYYSALVLAPKQSIVRRHFERDMPKGVQVKSGLDEDWGPLLRTLEGHTDYVTSVSFSATGDQLASASYDKTVRVWDAKTGQLLHKLQGHLHYVTSVAFSPTGDQLASASQDKTVRVWNRQTGQLLHMLKGHISHVTSVAFSPTEDLLASASWDETVRVWDAQTGQLLHTLKGHTNAVSSVAFSPSENQLASAPASRDKTVQVWDAQAGSVMHSLKDHTGAVESVAFSASGNQLASASWDETVRVWDAQTGQLLHTLKGHTNAVSSVAFSPSENQLASASWDKTVQVWDAQNWQLLYTLKGHISEVRSVVFSPTGDILASASNDRTVQVWDAKIRWQPEGHNQAITSVAFSGAGDRLASASENKTVLVWDTRTGQQLHTLKGHTRRISSIAFSKAGDRLASASWDLTVQVWDVKTGQLSHTFLGHEEEIKNIVFSPTGDQLASASSDSTARVWDLNTGQLLQTLEACGPVINVAFSPAGDRLASASSWSSMVQVWDIETGQQQLLMRHAKNVNSVAFSPAGDRLASASWHPADQIWEWELETGRVTNMLKYAESFDNVVFSPTGDQFASSSCLIKGTVSMWDAKKGELLHTLKLDIELTHITFSSDGAYLETDRGSIPLSSLTRCSTNLRQSFSKHIFVNKRWLTVDSLDLMWLPANYRPQRTAVSGSRVAFGFDSGRVMLLELS